MACRHYITSGFMCTDTAFSGQACGFVSISSVTTLPPESRSGVFATDHVAHKA